MFNLVGRHVTSLTARFRIGRIELLQNGARDACPAPTSDSRTALVLQLSAKVSEQEAEITRLNGVMRQQRMQSGDSDSAGARIPSTSTSTNAAPQRSRWISSAERELQSKELDGRRSSISGGDECDHELDNIRSCSRSVDVDVAVASRKDSVEKARIEMSGRDSGCGASDDIEIGGKSADDVRSVNSVESENSGLYGGDVTDFALGEGDSTYNINPANLRKVSAARDRRRNVPPIAETGETYSEAAVGPLVSRKPPSGKKNCDQMIL